MNTPGHENRQPDMNEDAAAALKVRVRVLTLTLTLTPTPTPTPTLAPAPTPTPTLALTPIKDRSLGEKRLASMPDRVTNTARSVEIGGKGIGRSGRYMGPSPYP